VSLLGFACLKSGSALISPDRQMFRREKKAVFPFILFGLFDPEGLGAETGLAVSPVPLIPQEVAHLPLQSAYVQETVIISLKSNPLLAKSIKIGTPFTGNPKYRY
jgi:hypothetical protein